MKQIDFVGLFDREKEKQELLDFLSKFDVNNKQQHKGIYILGAPGCGKTEFVRTIINKDDYDLIYYDANDTRTKTAIPEIIGNRSSNMNVLGLFYRKKRLLVTVMDEMDYMSSGDKGGIKELIKYVRPKKTKKQMLEPQTGSPIIFIGSNNNDKKVKELINVCRVIELKKPSNEQMNNYARVLFPDLKNEDYYGRLVEYADGNMRKYNIIRDIYNREPGSFNAIMECLLYKCNFNIYTKSIVNTLFKEYVPISDYSKYVRETDRTTLGLLWHENVGSIVNNPDNIELYKKMLDNLCASDYIDRVIFQNQVWELSELNSFIKIFYNNFLLHEEVNNVKPPSEIIFTKVLTKYSSEYNNYCFLQQLEQKMFCEKNDMLHQFMNKTDEELSDLFYLTDLDVERMKRFIKNGEFTCA